jgi:hypothetical protein
MYQAAASCFRNYQRFYALMLNQAVCIGNAGQYVALFKPWIPLQERFHGISRSKHSQNMLYRKPSSPDYRLASENIRIYRNAIQEFFFIHGSHPLLHITQKRSVSATQGSLRSTCVRGYMKKITIREV